MRPFLHGVLALGVFFAATEGMTFMMRSAVKANAAGPAREAALRKAMATAAELDALEDDHPSLVAGAIDPEDPRFLALQVPGLHRRPGSLGIAWRVGRAETARGPQRVIVVIAAYEAAGTVDQVEVWTSRPWNEAGGLSAAR